MSEQHIPYHYRPQPHPFVAAAGQDDAAAPPPPPESFGSAAGPEPEPLPSRAEAAAARRREHAGVPFRLLHPPACTATVLPLSFADRALLAGIDARLQAELTAAIQEQSGKARSGPVVRSFADIMRAAESDERIANALCMAGFVRPRLVATEAEVGGDDVWVVTDVHLDDRKRYMNLVLGQGAKEDRDEIARFLGGAGVEGDAAR